MGCNAEKLQIQTAEMCGLFSSLFSWARRLFANCSKLPQRIATIVWHNKGALRENGTDIPHNLRKVLPAKAHAGTFPCGCGRSSGAPQAHKKLSPVSMRGNSQNGGQTTKSLLTKPQCSGVPIQQAVSLSSSFPRHCLLFVCAFSLKRQKAQGRRNCPCSRLLHTKPPRLPSRKPGRFVCFRGAFSGAHAKPCEGSFGKPRVCGESATPWHSTPVLWDHPRVCGGKGHLTLAVSHMHRINPAYAGKRESRQQDHTITWDHPRVCGEKARTLIVQNEPQGSPPRMRGKD